MKNPENLAKIPLILSSAAGINPSSFPNVKALNIFFNQNYPEFALNEGVRMVFFLKRLRNIEFQLVKYEII